MSYSGTLLCNTEHTAKKEGFLLFLWSFVEFLDERNDFDLLVIYWRSGHLAHGCGPPTQPPPHLLAHILISHHIQPAHKHPPCSAHPPYYLCYLWLFMVVFQVETTYFAQQAVLI